jgi:HSP20 family molecular chaperone IbpA
MNLLPVHRRPRSLLPDPFDWLAGFPSVLNLRPIFDSHLIKVEDEREDGRYIVRAEIPGVDPDKDVSVTVRDGLLTIKAERTESSESKGRSEFSYGSFLRSVSLPPGAQEDDIVAGYDKGILTVTVPISENIAPAEKQIKVKAES